MIGTTLRTLQEQPELSSNRLTKVINEAKIESADADIQYLADFLPVVPDKNWNHLAATIGNPTGMSQPFAHDGNPGNVDLPNVEYRRYNNELNFREHVMFGEADLKKLRSIENLDVKMTAQEMQNIAIPTLKRRFINRRAWIATQIMTTNGYSIDENGVIKSESTMLPGEYFLDLNDTEASGFTDVRDLMGTYAWTPTALWSSNTAAIGTDLLNFRRFANDVLTSNATEMIVGLDVMKYLDTNNEWRDIMKREGIKQITEAYMFEKIPALKGLTIRPVSPFIELETRLVADATLGSDSTLTVDNIQHIGVGDVIKIVYEDSNGNRKMVFAQVHASSAPSGNTVTLTGTLGGSGTAKAKNSRVIIRKRLIPEGYVILKSGGASRMEYTSSPGVFGNNIQSPKPGWVMGTYISPDPERPYMKIYGGIDGGVNIWEPGDFVTLRVA